MRWFRPRPQPLVLRTVQFRVALVDPDLEEPEESHPSQASPVPEAIDVPERTTLVPEISDGSGAPPLAVRPQEDPEWVMHN